MRNASGAWGREGARLAPRGKEYVLREYGSQHGPLGYQAVITVIYLFHSRLVLGWPEHAIAAE